LHAQGSARKWLGGKAEKEMVRFESLALGFVNFATVVVSCSNSLETARMPGIGAAIAARCRIGWRNRHKFPLAFPRNPLSS
jgi:hypothetical protein